MESLVSVIVPVYNTELFLDRCIRNLIKQSYRNVEILLIDDGSTDNSSAICSKYIEKDSRVKMIQMKNSGVSAARNRGLEEARGKYICFVDSDDLLALDAIEKLYTAMVKDHADFCYGAVETIAPLHNVKLKNAKRMVCRKGDNRFVDYLYGLNWGPYAKLFRSDTIKRNNVRFNSNVRYGEDAIFISEYLHFCTDFSSIEDVVYQYNKLNVTSATKKCHPDINQWMILCVESLYSMISPQKYVEENYAVYRAYYIKEYFRMACVHYVMNLNYEEALKKLDETVVLFSEFTNKNAENSTGKCVQNIFDEAIIFSDTDVNSLYDSIQKKIHQVEGCLWRKIGKRFLGNIKLIILFDWKIG